MGLLCQAHIVHLALGIRPSDVSGWHAATPNTTQTTDPVEEEELGRGVERQTHVGLICGSPSRSSQTWGHARAPIRIFR